MPVKPRELAGARLGVEPLRVARLAHLERCVDEHLDEREARGLVQRAGVVAPGAVRADDRDERDDPGVGEEAGDLGDATHVLGPVLAGEAEVAVEPVAEVVAVERVAEDPGAREAVGHGSRDRRLARNRRARSARPSRRGRRPPASARHAGTPSVVPDDVRTGQSGRRSVHGLGVGQHHPGADRLERRLVDEDEAARSRGCAGTRRRTAARWCAASTRPMSFIASAAWSSSRWSELTSSR